MSDDGFPGTGFIDLMGIAAWFEVKNFKFFETFNLFEGQQQLAGEFDDGFYERKYTTLSPEARLIRDCDEADREGHVKECHTAVSI